MALLLNSVIVIGIRIVEKNWINESTPTGH